MQGRPQRAHLPHAQPRAHRPPQGQAGGGRRGAAGFTIPPRQTSWSSVRMSTTLGLRTCRVAPAGLSISSAARASPRTTAAGDMAQQQRRAERGTGEAGAARLREEPRAQPKANPQGTERGPAPPRHMTRERAGRGWVEGRCHVARAAAAAAISPACSPPPPGPAPSGVAPPSGKPLPWERGAVPLAALSQSGRALLCSERGLLSCTTPF